MKHREASSLLPWFVNGTLSEFDRQKVDEHVRVCALCRADLALETQIYQGMAAESAVEYMPAASLKNFQQKVDRLETEQGVEGMQTVAKVAPVRRPLRWRSGWGAGIAATVAIAAAASLLTFNRMHSAERVSAVYHTVTNSEARSPREVIRAVFSPDITLVELQAILNEAELEIVSGPTEAGVYSLAAKSKRPVGASLALLRQHATVRFAESTHANPAVAGSP